MKFLLFLLMLSYCTISGAQQLTISDELPLRSDLSYDIIGEFWGRVLLFQSETQKFRVQAFDENMRSSWNKEIELDKRLINIVGINTVRDSFTLFYYFREKGDTYLKAARFDPSANLKDSITLADLGFLFISPDYEMTRSEDRSKVLLHFRERDNIFRCVAFDNETMQVLWNKSFMAEDFNETDDVLHMLIDNAGTMYAIFEKDHFHIRRERHRFEVYRYNSGFPDIVKYAVPMQEKITYDVKFLYDNLNNKLVGGGFYYEKSIERAEGYFYLSVPENAEQAILVFNRFDDSLVERLAGKEMKNNRGVEEVSVQDLVLRRDGGLLIIGEENKNYFRRMAAANRSLVFDNLSRNVVDYFYDDIFVISVHPDGKPHWNVILHKKQYSQDDAGAFSSFFLCKTPLNLRLIFNDEIKFENTVSEYIVRGAGGFDRNSILSTEHLDLRMRFRDALQVSPDRIVVPSEKRGKLRLARIDLL